MILFWVSFLCEYMILIWSDFLIIYATTFFRICKFSVLLKTLIINYNIIKSMKQSMTNNAFINSVIIFEKSIQFMCNFWNFFITIWSNDQHEIRLNIFALTHASQSVMKKSINFIFKLFVFNFFKLIDSKCFMRECHSNASLFKNAQGTVNANKTDLIELLWFWKNDRPLTQNIKQIDLQSTKTRLYSKLTSESK